nr:chloride channel protein [Citrobacter sp. wls619]
MANDACFIFPDREEAGVRIFSHAALCVRDENSSEDASMRSNHFLLNNSITALGQWLALALLIAVLTGTASALFLFSLDWATTTRVNHHWLIWLLPVTGFIVGWIYLLYGSAVEGGNNLVLDEIHHPHSIIRLRMAPLVFISTVISHLFGASVGREGTAVQMGVAQ